jgi:hypothetical protein
VVVNGVEYGVPSEPVPKASMKVPNGRLSNRPPAPTVTARAAEIAVYGYASELLANLAQIEQ